MSQFTEITQVLKSDKEAVFGYIHEQLFAQDTAQKQEAVSEAMEAMRDSIVSEMIRLARLHSIYTEPMIHAAIDCWLDEDAGVCGGLGFLYDET